MSRAIALLVVLGSLLGILLWFAREEPAPRGDLRPPTTPDRAPEPQAERVESAAPAPDDRAAVEVPDEPARPLLLFAPDREESAEDLERRARQLLEELDTLEWEGEGLEEEPVARLRAFELRARELYGKLLAVALDQARAEGTSERVTVNEPIAEALEGRYGSAYGWTPVGPAPGGGTVVEVHVYPVETYPVLNDLKDQLERLGGLTSRRARLPGGRRR